MIEKECCLSPPAVSIGMPVYNGGQHVAGAIESILAQTFKNFEIIISDNASTDETSKICQEYAALDTRIRYIRQKKNIGALNNFLVVLEESQADLFKWQACDDTVSNDFLELNHKFLNTNTNYVASTSPNGFEGKPLREQTLINFTLNGDVFQRFTTFFNNCWNSHGVFYALIRRDILINCDILRPGPLQFAQDWSIDLYLASKGRINRTDTGSMTFGVNGISRGADAYKIFRLSNLEFMIPFYYFSKNVIRLIDGFSARQKIVILSALIKLNIKANYDRLGNWRNSMKMKVCSILSR